VHIFNAKFPRYKAAAQVKAKYRVEMQYSPKNAALA